MNYKETLNLPRTDFPMKADLPRREPMFLQRWAEIDLYNQIRAQARGAPSLSCTTAPPMPTATSIWARPEQDPQGHYRQIPAHDGLRSPYMPGWDCHGLPIEHQVDKETKAEWDADCPRWRCADAAGLTPKSSSTSSAPSSSAWGCWAIGTTPTLPCVTPTWLKSGGIRPVLLQRAHSPRQKAHPLVRHLPDRPGRSRGGIRRPPHPDHLREISAERSSGE